MTIEQGKEMNRRFVILKDSIKRFAKMNDTLEAMNTFLVDYNRATVYTNLSLKNENSVLLQKNENLIERLNSLKDTLGSMNQRMEFERLKSQLILSHNEGKMDLYKSELQTKTDMFNIQLENERRRGQHNARTSAILSGLIVGGAALTGAMVMSWMPSTWFKK